MRMKTIKQYDSNDCAAACIATIAGYFGKNVSLVNLQQDTNMNKNGASVEDIVVACEKIGLYTEAVKKTNEFTDNNLILPCIAHVFLDDGVGHYIVIYKISKEKIYISDPAIGLVKIEKKPFFDGSYIDEIPYLWSGILIFVKPGKNFKKDNDKSKNENDFWNLILLEKKAVLNVVALSALSLIFSLFNAFYFKIILDIMIPNKLLYSMLTISILFIFIYIMSVIINIIRAKISLNISRSINTKLLTEYYNHILRLPLSFFETHIGGDLISRFQDVSKIQEILVTSILILPVDIVLILVVGVILWIKSVKILILVLLMCFGYFFVAILFRKNYIVYNSKQMVAQSNIMSHLKDSIDAIETIKTYLMENKFLLRGKEKINKWQNSFLALGYIENYQTALKTLITGIGELIIIYFGAREVILNKISLGDLITYNILIGYVLSPISDILYIQPQIHTAQIAMERLKVVLQSTLEEVTGESLSNIFDIKLNNIKFNYNQYSKILKGITLEIKKGQNIALVGNNGSGKTTIAKLLTRQYDIESGEIFINGINISHISKKAVRQNIIYVSQDDFIFTGSLRNNLTLGNKKIDDNQISYLINLLGIDNLVDDTPNQYDKLLEERGANLSKGQKQKIALVRAILCNPQVLILDEATSNIDAITEKRILQALKSNKDLTLIMITHRFESIFDSDCIYVIDDGQVLKKGIHNELMLNCSFYKKIFINEKEML